jgi:hypothetical protein
MTAIHDAPRLRNRAPLDAEGLPFAACQTCGGGLYWKPATLPFAGPGWRCEACNPPPAEGWRHAVAVPVAGARHDALLAGDGAPRADGLDGDAGALLDFLRLHGPTTYGAAASSLGWGATRAWQAEARLRAAGLVTMGPLGVAVPVEGAP